MSTRGPILVVHADRKTQRQLTRVLAATLRPVIAVDSIADGYTHLDDGPVAAVVTGTAACRADPFPAFRDAALAGGAAACLVLGEGSPAELLPLVRERALTHVVGADPLAMADEVPATVQKLLRGDLFGLEKYLGWGASVRTTEVRSTSDRLRALAELQRSLAGLGLSPRHERHAALIADELMSNAIHNAPLDDGGQPYLRDARRDTSRELGPRERPRLRWGCDGRYLAIEVGDRFGTLDGETVRQHVGKLADPLCEPRSGTGGAGLGLAMAFQAASQLVFNLAPGRAAEVIGLIDLRPRPEGPRPLMPSLHVFVERAAGPDVSA